jgi:hypothetical protein
MRISMCRYWAYADPSTGQWLTAECPTDRCAGSLNISAQCAGQNRDQGADNQLCGRCRPDHTDVGGSCVCAYRAH